MPNSQPSLRVDVIYPANLKEGDAPPSPTDPNYNWHFLAEGDSWFTIGAVPSSNLLFELRLAKWTRVLNLAYPGDTILHISDLAANKDLKAFLAKRNFNYPFDALLLSGGGNDVIDAAKDLIDVSGYKPAKRDPEAYINRKKLDALLTAIQDGYAAIIALRDADNSQSKGRPAFVHTYDYPTPRDAPARFVGTFKLLGPWLYKVFKGSAMDVQLQQLIVNRIMDALADSLLELDCEHGKPGKQLPAVYVIDTRNTLVMANPGEVGNSNDWLNEIHPNMDGYRKIADRLSARINEVMLG